MALGPTTNKFTTPPRNVSLIIIASTSYLPGVVFFLSALFNQARICKTSLENDHACAARYVITAFGNQERCPSGGEKTKT